VRIGSGLMMGCDWRNLDVGIEGYFGLSCGV